MLSLESNCTMFERRLMQFPVMIPRLETDAIRDKKDNRPLLHQKAKGETEGKIQVAEEKVLLEQEERFAPTHVIFGTLPCVLITSLNQDANRATNVDSDTLRLMVSPAKVENRWCETFSDLIERVYTLGLCVSGLLCDKICDSGRRKFEIKSRRQILQRHVAPHEKSGKERVHR